MVALQGPEANAGSGFLSQRGGRRLRGMRAPSNCAAGSVPLDVCGGSVMCRFCTPAPAAAAMFRVASPPCPGQETPRTVPAAALAQEFARDEKATKARYYHKRLAVEGKVVRVVIGSEWAPTITLAGHDEKAGGTAGVVCWLPRDLEDRVRQVREGDTVRVEGEFDPVSSSLAEGRIHLFFCNFAH